MGMSGCSRFNWSSTWMPSSRLPCSQMSSTTRCGRRWRTALMQDSPSAATRVSKPSSRMIPETRSRMSSSSSTTRISGAASNPFLLIPNTFFVRTYFTRFLPEGEEQRHDRAVLLPIAIRATVGQRDFAAMVFGNLAHDGEPEAGALRAGGHIGLGQPVALLMRQADAVVGGAKCDAVADQFQRRHDMTGLLAAGGFARRDRLAGILEHVGERLAHQPSVAFEIDRLGRRLDVEFYRVVCRALQEHRLVQQLQRVLPAHHWRRHARERGEFVDHAADVADLADDGVRALGENFRIGDDLLAVFALEALGGKLDRRQRVLDLMGDAARDVGPGGGALGGDQIGDVVESDDEAGLASALLAVDLDAQIAHLAAALDARFPARPPDRLRQRAADQAGELGNGLGIMAAFDLFMRGIEQARGGAVDDGDAALAAQADDAGADAGQHRFGEPPPHVDLVARIDQFATLAAQLRRHAVEGMAQNADLVVVALDGDARAQIAFGNAFGGIDQL